ncbi:MAG: ASPIC/UnbV domain-containing protein, partial [Candidatus Acidiferrales bacterium]
YQSAQDPRFHFGLGHRQVVDSLQIAWPSGSATTLQNVNADQVVTIKEGQGLVERPFPRVPSRG